MSVAATHNGYEPVRNVTDEEIRNFVMPRPKVGQPVVWYAKGLRNDKGGDIGIVVRVEDHSLAIRIASGRFVSGVKHVDDPRLHKNHAQRENGAWGYTDYDIKRDEEMQELRDRLDAQVKQMLGQMNGLKGQLAKKGIIGKAEETKEEAAS